MRAELRARWAARAGLWQEANHDLVAADFQSRMTTMVERSGGRIISSQMLPVAKENGFVRITVRIEFGLSVNALRDLMLAVANTRPLLFLDNIAIRAPETIAMAPSTKAGWLAVRWDVVGYQAEGAP